jgi:hypothetical protein
MAALAITKSRRVTEWNTPVGEENHMRKVILLLLLASHAPALSAQELKNARPCGDSENISAEFREIAGEAFDIVGSLQEAELKGKVFYEPVLQKAEVAVRKATRKAISPDEQSLARCLESYKNAIDVYRSATEFQNIPEAPKNPEFLNALKKGQEEHKEEIHQALAARGGSGFFRMAEPITKIVAIPLGPEC